MPHVRSSYIAPFYQRPEKSHQGAPHMSHPPIDILAMPNLSPMYPKSLEAHFRLHRVSPKTDPAAFAAIAPHIRAIAGGGESHIDQSLLAQLPALQLIS